MKIDVSDIIDQPGVSISFSETGMISPFPDADEEVRFPNPLMVKGIAVSTGSGVYVEANVKGVIGLVCSRCLRDFDLSIEFDCEAKFVDDPEFLLKDKEDDIEVFLLVDGNCLLDDMVQHEVMLNIPMKPLCADKCKGFCGVCGADLNDGPCRCETSGVQVTPFGRKLFQALEKGGERDACSTKEEDIEI